MGLKIFSLGQTTEESARFFRRIGIGLRRPWVALGVLLGGDTGAAGLALLAAVWLWTFTSHAVFSLGYLGRLPFWVVGLVPLWLFMNLPLYDVRRAAIRSSTVKSLLWSAGLSVVIYFTIFFFVPRDLLPRLVFLYFVAGTTALTLIWRLAYIGALETVYFQRRLIIVGAGWSGRTLLHALHTDRGRHWVVAGLIDETPERHGQTYLGVPVLGGAANLLRAVRQTAATDVALAVDGELRGEMFQALLECQAAEVPVVRMPVLFEQLTGQVPVEHIDAAWANESFIEPVQRRFWYNVLARAIDLAGALAGLGVLAPFFPFIAGLIWLESRGPILYFQMRVGRNGQPFQILKFRTMVPEAEADGQARWASRGDERITRVGWWLRRLRLDEAPQFLNVLRGEMSLVGPRPERPEFTEQLEREIPFFRARLLVKPGLTGWAQVNYGYAGTVADNALKLQWDLYYIKHQSLWLDVLIMLRTLPVILGLRGT